MTIPQLFNTIISKSLFVLFIPLLLVACGSEENYNGSTGAGVSSGAGINELALTWVAPVEREDGTPIAMAEIGGYRIYFGTSAGNYTNEIEVTDKDTMQVTLSSLPAGTYYIVVTTYDIDGRESVFSPEVITSV